jgi:hypothetical protein
MIVCVYTFCYTYELRTGLITFYWFESASDISPIWSLSGVKRQVSLHHH